MKRIISTAIAAALFAAPVAAQSVTGSNEAQSQSYSGSSVYQQGDKVFSGTAIAPSMGTTAPCVIGQSVGVVMLSAGGGKIDSACVTRRNAAILDDLEAKRARGMGQAATAHLCRMDAELRETMVALGWCSYTDKHGNRQ